MDGDQTPIPPFAEEALEALQSSTPDDQLGIEGPVAMDVLLDHGFTEADAAEALDVLEMRGYLYRVDSELRITN
jgi:hypothetical protein